MSEITTIGLDLAKHVFQVHGIDAEGTTVLRKRLRRGRYRVPAVCKKPIHP
jgi:transposase